MRSRSVTAPIAHGLSLTQLSVLLVAALGVRAPAQVPPPEKPLPTLVRVDQIRRLSPEQASLGYPVLVRGVITMDAPAPDFFVQDATAGIYVE